MASDREGLEKYLMNADYTKQASLVIKAIPHIATEDVFALKGGTAINLFERDLPRLSVDVDLTYTAFEDRDTATRDINAALERISQRLKRFGIENRLTGTNVSRKIICTTPDAAIKIEPNFILRGTIFPTRKMSDSPSTQKLFGLAKINVLSRAELYGGKFCAALDRQHPRDLFDVAQFYASETLTDEIKTGFIALALCHNRPLHEILNPIIQDHRLLFDQQFAGMSDTPFSYEEHVATLEQLQHDILLSLTDKEKQHLIDFISLKSAPSEFGIPNLERLPAIAWKRKNLQTLKKSNPHKFEEQLVLLNALFN